MSYKNDTFKLSFSKLILYGSVMSLENPWRLKTLTSLMQVVN
jgi:hypothetical protein